jgi:hypothetical protein
MKNAAIIALVGFSFLITTLAYISYRNYSQKCDISGGIIGKQTKSCTCIGIKVPIKNDPKIRDGFNENFCVGIQKTTFKR